MFIQVEYLRPVLQHHGLFRSLLLSLVFSLAFGFLESRFHPLLPVADFTYTLLVQQVWCFGHFHQYKASHRRLIILFNTYLRIIRILSLSIIIYLFLFVVIMTSIEELLYTRSSSASLASMTSYRWFCVTLWAYFCGFIINYMRQDILFISRIYSLAKTVLLYKYPKYKTSFFEFVSQWWLRWYIFCRSFPFLVIH